MLPSDYRTHDPLIDRHLVEVDDRVAARRRISGLWTAILVVAALLIGTGVLVWLTAQ